MNWRVLVAVSFAVATAVLPAEARAASLACGDVVTESVMLSASLTGCSTGLVAGANGITIDLNGYSIEGTGPESAGIAVEAIAFSGVTVRNGRISGFATGVRLFNSTLSSATDLRIDHTGTGILVAGTQFSSSSNRVVGNTVTDSAIGIATVGSANDLIGGNTLVRLSTGGNPGSSSFPRGTGILCRDSAGHHIEGNSITESRFGYFALFCGADLIGNVASSNLEDGISRDRSDGLMERNRANNNGGYGINSFDSHGLFFANVTNGNAGNGLAIGDSVADHGPLHTVTSHLANNNGLYGIYTALAGIIDGGKNRANHNAEPAQCVGVVCR